jgi:ferredoxin-fold anticodon binding domain-containing protein
MRLDKLSPKIAKVLRDITYDNNQIGQVCRAFMITGAGAEGLSLKNVRSVHIMEPFWNKVRTDQVKGRAIRICSHSELTYNKDPELNERTVEVFTYISKFVDPKTIDITLQINDESKTTDEFILDLAVKKDKINSSFLDAMKSGAIDCQLNSFENEQITCFIQEGSLSDFMYDPRLKNDIATTEQSERTVTVQRKEYKIAGISYAGVQRDNKIILYNIKNIQLREPLGEITTSAEGKKQVVWLPGKKPVK